MGEICIHSKTPLDGSRGGVGGRDWIEDDIEDMLGEAGECVGGGSGLSGWDVHFAIFGDETLDYWLNRIVRYLRRMDITTHTKVTAYLDNNEVYRDVTVLPNRNAKGKGCEPRE
ncbi:MAG: hypothetical protein ACFCD0_25595 [Gemmataceae bacterium]